MLKRIKIREIPAAFNSNQATLWPLHSRSHLIYRQAKDLCLFPADHASSLASTLPSHLPTFRPQALNQPEKVLLVPSFNLGVLQLCDFSTFRRCLSSFRDQQCASFIICNLFIHYLCNLFRIPLVFFFHKIN